MNLKKIPKTPGIYQFFDKDKNIIYIGKSVNLFSRVSSYFNGIAKLNFAKQKMVKQIVDIKTIITNNEIESLMLESNLIKKHKPKYNILLKDDKNHLYIKITDSEYPKILRTRIKNKSGTYFGPYISSNSVNNILKIIKRFFGYGVEKHNFFMNKSGYNLDKYLFKGDIKSSVGIKEKYNDKIEEIKIFLKGDYKKIIKSLELEMKKEAKKLKFERAATIKENIESIKTLDQYQIAKDQISGDYDIINYIEKYNKCYIGLIQIVENKIVGYYNYEINNKLKENKTELIKYFIEDLYIKNSENKKIKYISPIKIKTALDIKIEIPKIGAKLDLLELVYRNIYEYAHKKHINSLSTKGFSKKTMQNLLEILDYKQINKNIIFECNDISHISGNHTVASRSIIENGKSNKSKYKKFNIKTLDEGKIDDFGSMREIMTRRLKEIEKLETMPDLIIIDGGKGQLSSVVKIIQNYKITHLPKGTSLEKGRKLIDKLQVVGIAKREEELFIIPPLNPLLDKEEKTNEVSRSGSFKKIILDKKSNELRLVQKIRDEAHRFAITFNRDKRIVAMKKNILESLPGFGPKTRKKLLKKFGNIESIKKEGLDKIISKTQIATLEDHGII